MSDEDGTSCSCICEDDSWADHNILGSDSCVPIKAHMIFGSVGIVLSVAVLSQALYQLHLQLKFHAQQFSVSTTPAECCRKNMHVTAVANAVINIFYFLLVLLAKAHWHQTSVLVVILNQITVSVCGFLTIRMWIYTNDARLMRGSSTMLRISAVLEEKTGQRLSYLVLSTGPVVATVLALLGRTEAAAKLVAATFILLIVFADATFWIFGRALLRAISASLENSRKRALESLLGEDRRESVLPTLGGAKTDEEGERRGSGKSAGEGKGRGRSSSTWSSVGLQRRRSSWWGGEGRVASELGDGELQAAKSKVKWAMAFCAHMSLQGYAILLFSIFSKYGTSVPLVLFGVQMAIVPLVWHAFNIQLHARRSRASAIGRRSTGVGGRRYVIPAVGSGTGNNVGQVNSTSKQGHGQQQQQQHTHQKCIGGAGIKWSKYGSALRGCAVVPTEMDDAAAATGTVTGETNTNEGTGTTRPADRSMSESVSAPSCRGVSLQPPME
ncbi:unnamed protein product [Ectocarpus fasciculatus]